MTRRSSRAAIAFAITLVSLTAACASSSTAGRQPAAGAVVSSKQDTVPSTRSAPTSISRAKESDARPTCQILTANLAVLEQAAIPGGNPDLPRAIASMRALERSAPAEIKPDIKVIADFDQDVLDAVSSDRSAGDVHETPQLSAALGHQATWVSEHCP